MLFNYIRRLLFGFTWPAFVHWFCIQLENLGAFVAHRNKHSYQTLNVPSDFDRRYNVSTGGVVSWHKLRTGSSSDGYSTNYSPTPPSVVRVILSRFSDVHDFSFVDIGCGKGRVLIIATEFPFKAAIGIEKIPELYKAACENARIVRQSHPERPEIQLVLGEATNFVWPPGNLVIYLFHPFWKPVMASMVKKIEGALKAEKRQLWVVYVNPALRAFLDSSPFLVFDRERSFILPPDDERGWKYTVGIWRARTMDILT